MATNYDKDKHYRKEIDAAAALGEYRLAAELEAERNSKIDGENMEYEKTYDYARWLKSDTTGNYSYGSGYSAPPVYNNSYQQQAGALSAQLLGQRAFSYDPDHDPSYEQYRKAYTREGARAMQDTLGEISSRTGGLASSYAATAAAQANNVYMAKLSDKIPELRQLAYEMYTDGRKGKRDDIELLLALERSEADRYETMLNQYNKNRAY